MLIFKVHYCLFVIYRDCFIYCIYDVNITILIKYRNTIHLLLLFMTILGSHIYTV